ncbi:imidazoleglycerol-phosphate dehydratase [Anaerobacillus sp. MEB173]|uniref:imidazoleglycerol-phosphate dehydratase n=1 Tax=Anaerobacillus sp. MEB173 TaxID=3383345 RepID=UPI003F90CCFC
MTKRNNRGSKNQSSPKNGGKLNTEFGQEVAPGDNSRGKHYNSKRGSKSQLKHPNNH